MRRSNPLSQAARLLTWTILFAGCAAVWLFSPGLRQAAAQGEEPAGPNLSLEAYWQRVQESRDRIAALEGRPEAAIQAELKTLAEEWQSVHAIELPDGETARIDSAYIVAQLQAEEADLEVLIGLLDALLVARDEWVQGQADPADLRLIESILAQPEFQWPEERLSPLQEWWEQVLRRLRELLSRLAQLSLGVQTPLLNWTVLAAGLLALGLALAYAARGLLGSLAPESSLPVEDAAGEEDLTADSALQRAQELSEGGDYRTAVRYLYLSALLLLEERGLLRYDRSRTNREYLRSVAHLPDLAARLREVVEVFDRVWYGYQPLDESAYARYAAQVGELRRQK